MTVKDSAKQVIDALADSVATDDITHTLYVNDKFERGESGIWSVNGVSHEGAKQRLKKWLK